MRTKYKPWALPYINEHQEVILDKKELSSLSHLHMEIGSGKGAFIIALAESHKDTFYLAIEKNVTCSGFIAKKLVENKIENVKLINDDVLNIIDELKDESISVIYLNFSDPWPKKRHEKRRLTYPAFIDKYVQKLEKGGEIRFKTDNEELFIFSKETFVHPRLEIVELNDDYQGNDIEDPQSEYEIKKRSEGLKIHRMVLRKI